LWPLILYHRASFQNSCSRSRTQEEKTTVATAASHSVLVRKKSKKRLNSQLSSLGCLPSDSIQLPVRPYSLNIVAPALPPPPLDNGCGLVLSQREGASGSPVRHRPVVIFNCSLSTYIWGQTECPRKLSLQAAGDRYQNRRRPYDENVSAINKIRRRRHELGPARNAARTRRQYTDRTEQTPDLTLMRRALR
jgi:hypothetical protein